MDSFTKQPWEEFVIAGSIEDAMDTGETIDLANSDISAIDLSDSSDSTSTVVEIATKAKDDTLGYLKVRIKGGAHGEQHKITFRIDTEQGNQYEVDVKMKVKEI